MLCSGFETQDRRMVGVDESTELWRPPPKLMKLWAVVIAQLMERFLQFQRSAVRIPSLAKILHFTVNCIEKTKIKKKRPGKAHFFKKADKLLMRLEIAGHREMNHLSDAFSFNEINIWSDWYSNKFCSIHASTFKAKNELLNAIVTIVCFQNMMKGAFSFFCLVIAVIAQVNQIQTI